MSTGSRFVSKLPNFDNLGRELFSCWDEQHVEITFVQFL
jgi:hypothetical protein